MIDAVEVVRDKEGGYSHPEWEAFSLSLDDMEIIPGYLLALFEKAHCCKVAAVKWEDTVDEDCAAWMEYNEGGSGFASWSLAPPSDDAVLLSVHDTENGPVQLWALPTNAFGVTLAKVEMSDAQEVKSSPVKMLSTSFPLLLSDDVLLSQPRKVTGHAIDVRGRGDMGQAVIAHGPYSPGGAQNHYLIGVGAECELMQGGGLVLGCISFQDGNPQEVGPNGVTLEAVLAVCADRLGRFQAGPHANRYNAEALLGIERALEALKDRTRERDGGGR